MNDLPRTVRVLNRTVHNDDNVTLELADVFDFSPGQFLMIWLPGINEKPFSIAGHSKDGVLITVRRRVPFPENWPTFRWETGLAFEAPMAGLLTWMPAAVWWPEELVWRAWPPLPSYILKRLFCTERPM